MGKIKDSLKDGRIVGGVMAVGLTAVLGVGVVNVATAQEPAAVVETADPALTIDLTDTPYTNGLAAEQETDAAAVAAEVAPEAAEVAASAEADRVAAEQTESEDPGRPPLGGTPNMPAEQQDYVEDGDPGRPPLGATPEKDPTTTENLSPVPEPEPVESPEQ